MRVSEEYASRLEQAAFTRAYADATGMTKFGLDSATETTRRLEAVRTAQAWRSIMDNRTAGSLHASLWRRGRWAAPVVAAIAAAFAFSAPAMATGGKSADHRPADAGSGKRIR